jgi:hypothetical protein
MSLPSQPTVLSLANQSITVYRYEPFWFRVYAPQPLSANYFTQYAQPTTVGLTGATYSIGTVFNSGTGQFTSVLDVYSLGLNIAPNTESFTVVYVLDALTSTTQTFVYTVNVQAGRFFPPVSNSTYGFYKNEPIQANTVVFTSPFEVSTPTTSPTLPPGISFTQASSNSYYMSGTPLVQAPTSNYQVIGSGTGSNAGRIVTTRVNVGVGDERIGLFVTGGSTIVNNMDVGSAITTRTITANYPFQAGSNLLYQWDTLPNGISFTDASGSIVSSGFIPADVSGTLLLSGTPTLAAAKSFASNSLSSLTTTLTATRINPPNVTSNIGFTFSFQETVLFDDVTVPTLYVGVPLTATGISFRARTFFPSGALITSMTAPSLPAGLSLNFVLADQRGYLVGTPSGAVSGSYNIIATNSNAVTRTLSVPVSVVNDTVSFDYSVTPAIDTCYNFILSRPVLSAKTGYYPNEILFRATASSGANVILTAPGLAGTGMSLSNLGSNTYQLVGIPEIVESLKTLTVTANSVSTPSSNTTTIKYQTLNEVFTWSTVSDASLTFIQNKTITPIQVIASTLSERPIIGYSRVSGPTGLGVSTSGLITGAITESLISDPSSGSIVVAATTGYASGSNPYNYTVRFDGVVIAGANAVQTATGSFSDVLFRVIRYSGTSSTFVPGVLSNLIPYQNTDASLTLSITPSGVLSGDLTNVDPVLPEYGFELADANSFTTQKILATATNYTTFHRRMFSTDQSNVYLTDNTAAPFRPYDYGFTLTPTNSNIPYFSNAWTTSLLFTPNPSDLANMSDMGGASSNGFSIGMNGDTAILSLRNALYRSTDGGSSFSHVTAITDLSDTSFVGPIYGLSPNPFPPPGFIYNRLPKPTYMTSGGSIVSDGLSSWIVTGVGSSNVVFPNGFNQQFLRYSTDNGVTWTTDLNATPYPPAAGVSFQVIYGGNGRFFASVYDGSSYSLMYASSNTLTSWQTAVGVGDDTVGIAHGSDSNSLMAAAGKRIYASTDNGTTWIPVYTSSYDLTAIGYGNGTWVATAGSNNIYASTDNGSNWSVYDGYNNVNVTDLAYDGASWLFSGTRPTPGDTQLFAYDLKPTPPFFGSLALRSTPGVTGPIFVRTETPSAPALSFQVLSSSNIQFVEPATTSFLSYQYIPIETIQIRAVHSSNVAPFIYYFAEGLPRGLTLNLDLSGISATITGTASQFLDAATENAVIIAKGYTDVVGETLSFNTLIPRVVRKQDGAGAYTNLLRQYVEANAAQNAVNSRALPNQERRLGEFMAPAAPDVTLQTVPPYCFDPNCKTNS